MSLNKTAQHFETLEINDEPIEMEVPQDGNAIIVYDEKPSEEAVIELHDIEDQNKLTPSSLEVSPDELELEFSFNGIPGVDNDEFIEVKDEVMEVKDEDNKKKSKGPWDWRTGGLENFVEWLKDKWSMVPKHKGKSTVGVERAMNYLEELDKCISDAMRMDLDGILDEDKIEEIRGEIDKGLDLLKERLSKLEDTYKTKQKNKTANIENDLIKEAGSPFMQGMVVSVPLLISRVARTCINGTVSAGHDVEELFYKQVKDFDLTKREQAEVIQLLADMGFPLRRDRLHMLDQKFDETSSDNGDFAANFSG